uniref:Mitochondrial ribosomal protein S18B n=1 Tax=Anas platyrhynchos platyrhynchos TaxID=8840 RepID=A0A493U3P4_ANAPP
MAAGGGLALLRAAAVAGGALRGAGRPLWGQGVPQARPCSSEPLPKPSEPPSPYKEKPWEYLESAEYQEAYGDKPVWFGYRRNHKGAVPPQRTRKACLVRLGGYWEGLGRVGRVLGGTGRELGGIGGGLGGFGGTKG